MLLDNIFYVVFSNFLDIRLRNCLYLDFLVYVLDVQRILLSISKNIRERYVFCFLLRNFKCKRDRKDQYICR